MNTFFQHKSFTPPGRAPEMLGSPRRPDMLFAQVAAHAEGAHLRGYPNLSFDFMRDVAPVASVGRVTTPGRRKG
jgi:hypothetical protein